MGHEVGVNGFEDRLITRHRVLKEKRSRIVPRMLVSFARSGSTSLGVRTPGLALLLPILGVRGRQALVSDRGPVINGAAVLLERRAGHPHPALALNLGTGTLRRELRISQ